MDSPNPNQPAIQSQQSQGQGGNKEQSVSKQPMVYICGGKYIILNFIVLLV